MMYVFSKKGNIMLNTGILIGEWRLIDAQMTISGKDGKNL